MTPTLRVYWISQLRRYYGRLRIRFHKMHKKNSDLSAVNGTPYDVGIRLGHRVSSLSRYVYTILVCPVTITFPELCSSNGGWIMCGPAEFTPKSAIQSLFELVFDNDRGVAY